MNWQPIENAPKDRPILLYQGGKFAIGIWEDTSHQDKRLVSRTAKRETWEWVDVISGYWMQGEGEVYDPTHWCELTPPE